MGKEPPIEPSKEFAGVLARIAQVDAGFRRVGPAPKVADDEWEDAGPEKEGLDDETGEEYEVVPEPEDEDVLQIVELGNGSRVAFDATEEWAAAVAE